MESDDDDHQPTSEKPVIDGEDDEQSGSDYQVTTRSYECNFCKRGFSNAQALGGHMNIHRKDKAKLQQSSTQTQPSLDIPHHNVPPLRNWPRDVVSSQQDHHASSRDESAHDIIHRRKLPLFAESPTTTTTTTTSGETQKPEGQIHGEVNTERALSSGQGSSSELDLELRLGPDPQDSSSPSATGTTRKFF